MQGHPDSFLAMLGPEDEAALRDRAVPRRHRAGDTLLHQDDDPGRVLLVIEGRVRVSHLAPDGRETILAYCRAGDLVGELSAVDGLPRTATVEATEPVEVLALSGGDFAALLAARPGITLALLRRLAGRLRAADTLRIDQATRDVVARVCRRLADECYEAGEDPAPTVALSHDELAAWIGASREATSRALQLLRELGVVETGRRRIVVLDRAGLDRYAR